MNINININNKISSPKNFIFIDNNKNNISNRYNLFYYSKSSDTVTLDQRSSANFNLKNSRWKKVSNLLAGIKGFRTYDTKSIENLVNFNLYRLI